MATDPIFEAITVLEDHDVKVMHARAVLSEAEEYFECTKDAKYLPYYADHILMLLQVTNGLLHDALSELHSKRDELDARRKQQREEVVSDVSTK